MSDASREESRIKVPGTEELPYKLFIIGGGPSGCSVIVRAIRIGVLDRLCGRDTAQGLAGVCLIDKCDPQRFGGGKLQDYGINSNTFAEKFATGVLDDKIDALPRETCSGSVLENLKSSEYCKQLNSIGQHTGPLKVIGGFLRDVGSSVLQLLQSYPDSDCKLLTTVLNVQMFTRVDKFSGWKVTIKTGTDIQTIFCKQVLFATGGYQLPPPLLIPQHNSKVVENSHLFKRLIFFVYIHRLLLYSF